MKVRLITSEWWISVPEQIQQRILEETVQENVREHEIVISVQIVEDNGKYCFYIFTTERSGDDN